MGRHATPLPQAAETLRIDKWLWFARLAKSRSLAARLCAVGAVTIGGTAALRSSHPVRVGDVVEVPQGRLVHTVRVLALGARRGPAPEARQLYEAVLPPRAVAADVEWESLFGEAEDVGS
jgi:ribosome-associated heat shock protein Hsp15